MLQVFKIFDTTKCYSAYLYFVE